MRHLNAAVDLSIILCLTVAGVHQLPMVVIALGAGALAAGPIARGYAQARARPHIDARHVLRNITIDAALHATAAAIAAYLAGRIVALG